MRGTSLLLTAAISAVLTAAPSEQLCQSKFTAIQGYLCIRGAFVQTFNSVTQAESCAMLCGVRQQCQAFSMADGPCQLFVFHRCSKSVRDCSCSRTGQVFVKQQPGLQAGKLCPPGYGDDMCGVKYKVYSVSNRNWTEARQKCESESGLVIMADVTSAAEMDHVEYVRSSYPSTSTSTLWLGGFQEPGSAEPAGGWYWVGCNITVDGSLWAAEEPDGSASESWIGRYRNKRNLTDLIQFFSDANTGLCECLSPFD